MKVLILCTGNSCRSQMANGFLQSFDPHTPHNVNEYLNEPWDYVITVCGRANETCPSFIGDVKHRLHIGFDDPSDASGSEEYVMGEFRRIRDEIKNRFKEFYNAEMI